MLYGTAYAGGTSTKIGVDAGATVCTGAGVCACAVAMPYAQTIPMKATAVRRRRPGFDKAEF
jgi:hypothetical protein